MFKKTLTKIRIELLSDTLSKTIVGIISAAIAALISTGLLHPVGFDYFFIFLWERSYANILVLLSLVALIVAFALEVDQRRRATENSRISSKEWFAIIKQKLRDSSYSRIYLREFSHPQDFREEHKDDLQEIIEIIRQKIELDSKIQIISVKDNGKKGGDDWLSEKLAKGTNLSKHVRIRKSQPIANSLSMYLFDERILVFSKIKDGKVQYHIEKHPDSIIFKLIELGFEKLWRK